MKALMTAVLMAAVSGTSWGQTLESAMQSGAFLTKTARAQGENINARGSAPCTPQRGYAWCFAPSREAAMASLSSSARSLVMNGLKVQIGGLLIELSKLAARTNDDYLKKELKLMGDSYRGLQGEALFKTFVPAASKPTVTFSGNDIAYDFNVHLGAKVGSRPAFMTDETFRHLGRKHSLFCAEYVSLILWADKAGNARAENPLQTEDSGCVAD